VVSFGSCCGRGDAGRLPVSKRAASAQAVPCISRSPDNRPAPARSGDGWDCRGRGVTDRRMLYQLSYRSPFGDPGGTRTRDPSLWEREPAPFRPAAVLACDQAWSAGVEPALSGFVARRGVRSPTTRRGLLLLLLPAVCAARPPFDPGSAARCHARAVLRGGVLEPGAHRRVTSGNSGRDQHAAAESLSEIRTDGEGRSLSGGASVCLSELLLHAEHHLRGGVAVDRARKRATRSDRPRSFGGYARSD
jgi:hypothetical protein